MLVTIAKFSELTGYTQKAIRRKIEHGAFRPGMEFHRAPDGKIVIDVEGYEAWVKSSSRGSRSGATAYASPPKSTGNAIARL